MKLSDFVAGFLAQQGIRHVFSVTGGASLHLIHSVADHPEMINVCPQHEQAGAMAADGYARITGGLGAAIATSGPGATNLITGVCCAYYDSVPVIYITGNVSRGRQKRELRVRQLGFQETDTVDMFRTITKYAVCVNRPELIRYELEKAVYLAKSGRPGPVLVDIPDDVQREQIDPDSLEGFTPDPVTTTPKEIPWERIQTLIEQSERPILIPGWGTRLAGAESELLDLIELLKIPVAPTWATMDLLPADHPLLVGSFGTHGTRYGNFAVQNADLILAVGSRLDTHETGSPLSSFAREAKRIVVDVDDGELEKFERLGFRTDLSICTGAKDFLAAAVKVLKPTAKGKFTAWVDQIHKWKQAFPICEPKYLEEKALNPYVFVKTLSRGASEGATIYCDTGCAIAWMMQAFDFKKGQRLFHAFNNTPMGYGLPAAIGGSLALGNKPVICVTGDGALQMNLQELATVIRYKLPIKIFLLNNNGYSMIQQTQDQWLSSNYVASSVEGGLAFPNWIKLAESYGYAHSTIQLNQEADAAVQHALTTPGPFFCNVELAPTHRVIPQVKFGRPIEDTEPLLDRASFAANMLVKPMPVSDGS